MFGFVYIWFDRKHNRYYIGSHWGTINDGYICSSNWMRDAYHKRPDDFKRRIIITVTTNRLDLLKEEERWLQMIKPEELRHRYYNLRRTSVWHWLGDEQKAKSVSEKISATIKEQAQTPEFKSRYTPERAQKISESKRKKFEERRAAGLSCYDKPHGGGTKGHKHTEEWKQQNSIRLKEQWNDGTRKRVEPKQTMSREEQDKLCSAQLKSRWSDPVWRVNQIERLKEGAKHRP